jgi:hypothetical protein
VAPLATREFLPSLSFNVALLACPPSQTEPSQSYMLLPHCHCLPAPTLPAVVSADAMATGMMATPVFPTALVGGWGPQGGLGGAQVMEPKRALLPRKPERFLFPRCPSPSLSLSLSLTHSHAISPIFSVLQSRGRVGVFPSRTALIPHRVPLPQHWRNASAEEAKIPRLRG